MADFQLRRSYSLTLVPQFERPRTLVSSRRSIPDLTAHIRASDKYKPQWSASNYYRDHSDFAPYDDNWYMRNRYLNPKHWPLGYRSPHYWPRDNVKHLDYESEGVPNPYYPGNWWRQKNATGYQHSYFDNNYDRYMNDPYLVQDTENRSIARSLGMYRAGLINYSCLDRYFTTPEYWNGRQRDWRDLYKWEQGRHFVPSRWEHYASPYFAY